MSSKFIRSHAWKDTLWKAAVAGGILTACLQTCLGVDPLMGTLNPWEKIWTQPVPLEPYETLHSVVYPDPGLSAGGVTGTDFASESVPVMQWWNSRMLWASILVGLAYAAAVFELITLMRNRRRLLRALSRRRPCRDPKMLAMVEDLRLKAGMRRPVALTTMRLLPAPIAMHGEICLPERALENLDYDQLLGVLAHEIAHLRRWDVTLYQTVAVIEATFGFQPLLRLARRNLREEAEYICDDWASGQTGSTHSLAWSLIEVASWTAVDDPIPAPAFTSKPSLLARRVQRLMLASAKDRVIPPLRLRFAVALIIMSFVAWVVPGISTVG